MKLPGMILAATCAFYAIAPSVVNAKGKPKQAPPTEIRYTFEFSNLDRLIADINTRGEIAAFDGTADKALFIDKKGRVTEYDCFGDIAAAAAINNHGAIVGRCENRDVTGYIRSKDGNLLIFQAPCPDILLCQQFGNPQTIPNDMNDFGHAVGEYVDPPTSLDASGFLRLHSFLFKDGAFTEFKAPPNPDDVGLPTSLTRTIALSINNRGQIIGVAETVFLADNGSGLRTVFLYDNGQFASLPSELSPVRINNDGEILMFSETQGFVIYDDGALVRIIPPEGFLWASIGSLNDNGQLTGIVIQDRPIGEIRQIFQVIATPVKHGK